MNIIGHAVALVIALVGVTACCVVGVLCAISTIKVTGQETFWDTWKYRMFALLWFVLAAWGIIWFAQVTS